MTIVSAPHIRQRRSSTEQALIVGYLALTFFEAIGKGGDTYMARGSVVKRSGSWYAVYRVDGRQKWEHAGRTKKSAERLLDSRLHEIHNDEYVQPKRLSFADYARKWLKDYAAVSVKESTLISYRTIVERHLIPRFGSRMLHSIGTGDVQSFIAACLADGRMKPKTAVNILVPLKAMFKHAVIWGYLRTDPTVAVKRPKVETEEMDFLSPDEVRSLIEAVRPHYRTLIMTAIMTGMRRGELLALRWDDIDWLTSEINVRRAVYRGSLVTPKSKSSIRRIVMSPTLQRALREHRRLYSRKESPLVFTNENGGLIDGDNLVKREFLPALERAGLHRIRFHDLRHTYASLLIAQGENVKFVQHQLGHASAKTTLDRYGHLMPNAKNEAGARLDQTVFGTAVRNLLENPESEGTLAKKRNLRSLSTSEA